MAVVLIRPNHEWSLINRLAVEAVSANSVPLAPKVYQLAVLGALPINHAMQMRTGRGKVLHSMFVAQVPKMFGIDDVQHALFASPDHQLRAWNQDRSRRVQIVVILVQLEMVSRCKPVHHVHVWVEFDKALAELSLTIPTAVPGDEIDISFVIDSGRLTGLPDACFHASGRGIE